ncbi:hypothetical protein D3C87_144160 [compost metagenome]
MKNKFSLLISILFVLSGPKTMASGTVVGNGGDPLFEFLSATQASLIETLKILINSPADQNEFCKNAVLSQEQTQFCRDFLLEVAPQILKLSLSEAKTPFALRDEALRVTGPDGHPMVVSARTELGPNGPIEFHRDSVKTMLPTQVLFLLAHEFQHKVIFRERSISDNENIPPFASGRDLLDNVASAIVKTAKRRGLIGTQFGIRDIFDCQVASGDSSFGARISSSRLFSSEDLMSYTTSVGKNPTDGSIYIPESHKTSVGLRFEIHEPNNCGKRAEERETFVQVVRLTQDNFNTKEEVLMFRHIRNNPMCDKKYNGFTIEWSYLKFTCHYFGSQGTTSSPFAMSTLWQGLLPF